MERPDGSEENEQREEVWGKEGNMGNRTENGIDGHVHVFGKGTQGVRDMLAFEKELGYRACNFLSCECMGDATQNALGIYLKAVAPENYAFGGLTYRYDCDFAEELKTLWEIGFDGMKMVEDKPTIRKQLGVPFDDPHYDGFYGLLSQMQIPLVAHIADPEECWHRDQIEDWAYEAGYYYGDGGYVEKETLYREVEQVLARFPKLRVVFAHLFFMSADLERLDDFMERHPNVSLDIVSGTEMYFNFAKRAEDWRQFFLKYQDRIIYGTDNMNLYDEEEIRNARITNAMQRDFLAKSGVIHAWDKATTGIELPEEVQEKICSGNFLRIAGETPRPLNREAAARYLQGRLENERLAVTAEERAVIEEVLRIL